MWGERERNRINEIKAERKKERTNRKENKKEM